MSCSSCGDDHCNEITCDPANEPLASALNNFITSFYGSLTKTCVNNNVVWVLPCDLDNGITGYPRIAGEGIACYFLRVFNGIQASALILVDGSDTTPGFLADKVVAGGGVTITVLNPGGDESLQIDTVVGAPGKIGVTSADTTIDYLNPKLTVGTGLSKTVVNPGANETLNLVNTSSGKVSITAADTSIDFLNNKVIGQGITLIVQNPGGTEALIFRANGTLLVSVADTSLGFLGAKISVGPGLSTSITNPGANEVLRITNAASVSIAASNIDWSLSNTFFKTLGANTTFTFSNATDSQTIIVAITNTAGNFTAAWPVGVLWANGSEPVLTLGAKTDVFTFVRINAVLFGSVVANMT